MTLTANGKARCRVLTPQIRLIMKLTVILLICFNLAAVASGFSQTVSIHVTSEPLAKVFSRIEKQTGYVFFYDGKLLREAKPVTINVDKELEPALKDLFADQPLAYSMKEKTINVFKKTTSISPTNHTPALLSELPPAIDVHGKVTDESGKPAAGVAVRIKGTNKGTTTNDNGEFALTAVDTKATLVFSSVNMETFEIQVSGQSDLLVKLKSKTTALGEIIIGSVNTGYQSIPKERAVGSYSVVDSARFHREVSTNILSRLDGITSSVLFQGRSSGGGNSNLISIRGLSTIPTNGAAPLVIIDNFPYNGDISSININPNDVENITVLKDASAASIWGAKAGNGVIVITTKKGKYNQPAGVSIGSNFSVTAKPDQYKLPQISVSDFIDVEQFLFSKGMYNSDLTNINGTGVTSPVVEILNKQRSGIISQSDATSQIDALRLSDLRRDADKYIFRPSTSQQNYLRLSGGSDKTSYLFSFGYDRNLSGVQGPGKYERFTINSQNSIRASNALEILLGVNLTQNTNSADGQFPVSPGGGKGALYPYAQLADGNGKALTVPYKYRLNYVDTTGSGQLLDWHYRPIDELNFANNKTRTQYALVNLGLNYRVASWLTASVKYQYSYQLSSNRNLQSLQQFATRDVINLYSQRGTTLKRIVPLGAILDLSDANLSSQNARAQLNISKTWNNKHTVTALIAGEISSGSSGGTSSRIYGYNDENQSQNSRLDYTTSYPLWTGSSGTITNNTSNSEGRNQTRFVSFLANASYTYLNKYTVYASARKDGSNIFGVNSNNRWKPLWSMGGGWDISKESFYRLSDMDLKARISYGYTGNVVNTVPAVATIAYASGTNPYVGSAWAQIGQPPNPDLRWESVGITNVGIDFGFRKSGIRASVDGYIKNSFDVISPYATDPTLGITNSTYAVKNAGNLRTKGFDFNISMQQHLGAVNWVPEIQFSYAKTIVTKYLLNIQTGKPDGASSGANNGYTFTPIEGQMAFGAYAYKWAGLDPLTGDPLGYYKGQVSKQYLSIINDSIKNFTLIGSNVPLYFGNFMNTISWKQFSLSFNITYKFDYYFRKPGINYSGLFAWTTDAGSAEYGNRWQKPGDEKLTNVPSLSYPANSQRDLFYTNSEVNFEKADNIRLRDVRLQYTFNNMHIQRLPIKSFQVYIYMQTT